MNSALHPLLARILKTTLCAAVVLGSSPVLAQTASYLFEGNLDDSSNSYDATASGTTSFESGDGRNYLSLGADGVEISNTLSHLRSPTYA